MKKVLEKLKKPKKKEMKVYSSDQMCKDAVPDAPRDLKVEIPSKNEMYRNFRIDNSCRLTQQYEQNNDRNNSDSMTSVQENSLKFFQPSSLNLEAVPVVDINSRQRLISAPEEITQNVLKESHFISNEVEIEGSRSNIESAPDCGSGSGSESSESESGTHSRNENGNSLSVKTDSSIEKKNNTYVINISGSKHFQIGSQKNVFVNGSENGSLRIDNSRSNNSQQENLHLQKDLLNSTRVSFLKFYLCKKNKYNNNLIFLQPITTQDLTKIAAHINDNWREIGQHLGIKNSEIDEIVMVNDNNSTIIAFDMFKRFLEKNPETSVGFIAKVLVKSNQNRAIQQLTP